MKMRKNDNPLLRKFLYPLLWGLAGGTLLCTVLLLLSAVILATQDIPQAAVTPIALVASAAGAFLGGFISARISGEKGLLLGTLSGILLCVAIMLAGLLFLTGVQGTAPFVKWAVLIACGAAGGVLGVNLRKRH